MTLMVDGAAKLARERRKKRAYRRAFKEVLTGWPPPDDPAFGGVDTLLAAIEQVAATDPAFGLAWENITVFERWHPDNDALSGLVLLTAADLDAIYDAAMALEASWNA